MSKSQRTRRSGYVYFCPEKFERRLRQLGFSNTQLADKSDIARGTIIRASKGLGVYRSTATRIVEALDLDDATLLLQRSHGKASSPADETTVGEWGVKTYDGEGWMVASNGLRLRFLTMQHQFVDGRLGRGKWYDLLGLPAPERETMTAQLIRHPTVCERIGPHVNIAENLSTAPGPDGQSWWVIDRWHAGQTLAAHLATSPLPTKELPRLMKEIAKGLQAMHGADVVFRELAPQRVLIADSDRRAILTDFELAKLLDSSPTVSKDWPDDPYRAPEVKSGKTEPRSDLYSWARILTHAALGQLPPPGEDVVAISKLGLPKSVWKVATECLASGPSSRPANIEVVLRAINRWQ